MTHEKGKGCIYRTQDRTLLYIDFVVSSYILRERQGHRILRFKANSENSFEREIHLTECVSGMYLWCVCRTCIWFLIIYCVYVDCWWTCYTMSPRPSCLHV